MNEYIEGIIKCGATLEEANKIYNEYIKNDYFPLNAQSVHACKDEMRFYFKEEVSIKKIVNDVIILTNGMTLFAHHEQDCCERVYIEIDLLLSEIKSSFRELRLKIVPNMGFLFNNSLICCHNEQNGFYSSELILQIKWGNLYTEFNISAGNKDNIF